MSDRYEDGVSNRSLLARASEEDMQSIAEKELLFEYKKIVKQIDADQEELSKTRYLISQIYSQENSPNYHIKKDLQDSATKIAERINSNDRQLLALQSTPVLQNVLKREKEKAYERERQRGQEALAAYRERANQHQEELMQRYYREREERRRIREQEQASQETATASKESVQKSMVKKEEPKKVKRTLAAIPLSILGAWEVHLIYGLTNLIITLVFWLISYIPILNTLVEWLFRIREDTPDMFATFLAIGIAYIGFMATAHRIIKKVETRKLTLILTGIYLAISNFLFVIINLRYNDPILVNSLLTITGIVIFFKGKNT